MKKIELNLPEWAFLDSNSHLGNELGDRTIILHVRSASIVEILDEDFDEPIFFDETLTYEFQSYLGEKLVAALHYCATLDIIKDREMIMNQIIIPCANFYCEYSKWEDSNILGEKISKLN